MTHKELLAVYRQMFTLSSTLTNMYEKEANAVYQIVLQTLISDLSTVIQNMLKVTVALEYEDMEVVK